jgi:hypothetical protein
MAAFRRCVARHLGISIAIKVIAGPQLEGWQFDAALRWAVSESVHLTVKYEPSVPSSRAVPSCRSHRLRRVREIVHNAHS